jgi:hypothetical protein
MAYALFHSSNLPPGTNPVGKRLVVVNGAEVELYIDEIWDPDDFLENEGEEVADVSTGVAALSTVNNGGGGVQKHQQNKPSMHLFRGTGKRMNSLGCTHRKGRFNKR